MTTRAITRSLVVGAFLVALTSPVHAGSGTCVAVAAGGAVLAAASLFTGPGIFAVAPTIASFTALAC